MTARSGRSIALASLLLAALMLLGAVPRPATALAARADWPLVGGWFYTERGDGQGRGFAVTDEGGVPFWSALRRLGGVQAVGYPISHRFEWDGFTVQAFQRVVFQWRPESGTVAFVNVFDRLHELDHDDWLLAVRQTPRHGTTLPADPDARLALLDPYPALKAAYFAAPGDPIQANGLPTAPPQDVGNHVALRAQRVVLQLWKEDVPWARRGEVTVALGGEIALELGLFPSAAAAPQAPSAAARRRIVTYYVEWDPASWRSLDANWDAVDVVGAQWVWVDACGGLTSRDDQTLKERARARGVAVLPSLFTVSGGLNHRLLTDPTVSEQFLAAIVDYVVAEDYPGFDLDLEGVDDTDRAAYSAFVARLAEALHGRGKLLGLAVPPKERDVRTGWAGAYDYAALGPHADLITLMTYDYAGSWGDPGPVAPYRPVDAAVAFAASQMTPEKVNLGLAFYGYDWNTTTPGHVRALGYAQAAALSERYAVPIALDPTTRSATFRYRAPAGDPNPPVAQPTAPGNRITTRSAPPCPVTPPPPPPTPTAPPNPPPDAVQDHVVWLEESGSAAARLEIADRHTVGGVAAWRLGQEDPNVWAVLRRWRAEPP
ncbi:MAG TPA: glycosyl hydrolase family 18 protein [Chloroflexota bacterium]